VKAAWFVGGVVAGLLLAAAGAVAYWTYGNPDPQEMT
jgi:hypothetical protein